MANIDQLISGYRRFHATHFVEDGTLFHKLATQGQSPQTLVIACSDSRVEPSFVLDTKPGDIFVIRNVANLVPPYQPIADSYHGTSAALEFGICHLNIPNIMILGHSECAGIKALMSQGSPEGADFSFIREWVNIAADARDKSLRLTGQQEDLNHCCEKEAIKESLHNLMTFPWIRDRVNQGKLTTHGWHFCLKAGKMEAYSMEKDCFEEVV